MFKKKNFILMIACLLLAPAWSGCEDSSWHLHDEAVFKEYYPKYTSYYLEAIDAYGLQYNYAIKEEYIDKKTGNPGGVTFQVQFDDECLLTIFLSSAGTMLLNFWMPKATDSEEEMQIRAEYLEVVHKVIVFSAEKFGDENTFRELLQKANQTGERQDFTIRANKGSLGFLGYTVDPSANNGDKLCVRLFFEANAVDNNVWP